MLCRKMISDCKLYTRMDHVKQLNLRISLIISLCLGSIDLIGNSATLSSLRWFKWLPFFTMIALIFFACKEFQKRTKGPVRFRSTFSYGFKITLIVTGIMIAYRLLFLYVIFPGTENDIMNQFRSAMEKGGHVSRDNIESFLKTTRRMFVPFAILGSFATTMLCGIIASAIGAIYSKYRFSTMYFLTKSNDELCKQKP